MRTLKLVLTAMLAFATLARTEVEADSTLNFENVEVVVRYPYRTTTYFISLFPPSRVIGREAENNEMFFIGLALFWRRRGYKQILCFLGKRPRKLLPFPYQP